MADAFADRPEHEKLHFLTLEALEQYHERIFRDGASLSYIGKFTDLLRVRLAAREV